MIIDAEEPDFSPAHRREAIFASDARRLADGKAFEVWREKTGRADPPDLSDVEAVDWGHRLEEPIMRAAADRWGLNPKDLRIEAQHPTIPYMRSHFDRIEADGKTLYEIKNYNAFKVREYDEDMGVVPIADQWQCLHELECFPQANAIELIVLFGGQQLKRFRIARDERDAMLNAERELWDKVQSDTQPDPRTTADARVAYPQDMEGRMVIANLATEQIASRLRVLKEKEAEISEEAKKLQAVLMSVMKDAGALFDASGAVLATWRKSADAEVFDAKRFKAEYAEMYSQFLTTRPGARRFLLK